MQPEVRKIVLVPRFSAFVSTGARTFMTQPIRCREFASANVTVWRGTALGMSPTFTVVAQRSQDLQTWLDIATVSPSTADTETTTTVPMTTDWMRLSITLGGTNPALNCWAVGDFVPRVPAGG